MFTKHVTSLSSPYFHNQLTLPENQRVAEHLLSCTTCRADFDEVKLGVRFAEQLQIKSAPDSVWAGILAQLDQKKATPVRLWFMKPLAIAATIVLVIAGGMLLRRSNRNTGVGQWNVARLGGSPRIDSQNIGDRSRLGVGQWLETDATSRAQIVVATIGNVEIDPNSRVRLLETSSSEHRLELARGRLSAHISAPPKLFFVNTPSGVAEDLGCAYTLEVDDAGDSILHVTTGWVSMQLNGRESAVPAGAACATRTGFGPGTPYFEDATETFRKALTKIDFETGSVAAAKGAALGTVLAEARPRDAMTLWYLLSRVEPSDRPAVYARLAFLVPPPKGTSREGLLSLDREMLDRWREEIDKSRGLNSFGSLQITWRRIWTGTVGKVNGPQGKR